MIYSVDNRFDAFVFEKVGIWNQSFSSDRTDTENVSRFLQAAIFHYLRVLYQPFHRNIPENSTFSLLNTCSWLEVFTSVARSAADVQFSFKSSSSSSPTTTFSNSQQYRTVLIETSTTNCYVIVNVTWKTILIANGANCSSKILCLMYDVRQSRVLDLNLSKGYSNAHRFDQLLSHLFLSSSFYNQTAT